MKLVQDNSAKLDEGARKTLREALNRGGKYTGVIVLALEQDGSPLLMGSRMTHMEKIYLSCFAQRVFQDMFHPGDED